MRILTLFNCNAKVVACCFSRMNSKLIVEFNGNTTNYAAPFSKMSMILFEVNYN